jgi:flagellar protein FliO/FliZ
VTRILHSLRWTLLCTGAGITPLLAQTAAPAHAFAAPQSSAPSAAPSFSGLGQVTFALLVVLAAVFLVAWLVRRVRSFGNRVGTALDVLAEIPLGQKERAVLLKVGQTQILVGVAPGQVKTLHVLTEPIELKTPAVADARPSFKALMLRSLGK